MESKQIDVFDIILIILKHKRFVIITTILVSIAAVVFSLLVPQYWVSTSTIFPLVENQNSISLGSSLLSGFASSFLGEQSDVYNLIGVMQSRTFSMDVVKKFNLIEYFKIEEPDSLLSNEIAIKNLKQNVVDIWFDDDNNFISISAETKDKFLSSDISNYYWLKLDEYNKSNRMSKGKQQREFIDKRLTEVQESIMELSNKLNEFQKKYNTINLEEQAKSVISLYSDLVSKKIASDIELEFSKEFFSESSKNLEKLRVQNKLLNKKIGELEENTDNSKPQYLLSIDEIPDISLEYAQILLNLEIQQKVFEYLYPQFEAAKIQELKDLPTIELIDKAIPAGKRSKPKRAIICIVSFITALILSSLAAIIIENIPFFIKQLENKNKPVQ